MRFNGRAATDVQLLTSLVASDGASGGFLKDSDFTIADWTPTFTFASPGNLSVAYATQAGRYFKLNTLVLCLMRLRCTPTFTTSTGAISIGGLPIAAKATGPYGFGAASIVANASSLLGISASNIDFQAFVDQNATTFGLYTDLNVGSVNAVGAANLTSANFVEIVTSLMYESV